MRPIPPRLALAAALMAMAAGTARAATYEVGPGRPYATPSAVPWESLQPGDQVLIYWRAAPYKDKWVICRQGTAAAPIVVRGVRGPDGARPVIDGNGATTRLQLDYWGEQRAVIKIGGASVPADLMPRHIVVEGLEIRSARPPYAFTDDAGGAGTYASNAASVWIEKGEQILIRDAVLHDSGNGVFVSSAGALISRGIVIERSHIHGNGNVGSLFEHNAYTEALGIVYQFNRFGPLRAGASGNNLKDRSAGLVVRYNWIEGGNRQLDLVETDSATIQADASYRTSHVYGNVLIEPDGAGNRQIVHYGGDNGTTSTYRKGRLLFYQNTLVSTRADRTTLFRLSTNDEQADVRNNIFYAIHSGPNLQLLDATGVLSLSHNWFKPGYITTLGGLEGVVDDDGTSVLGSSPGFVDETAQDYRPAQASDAVDAGAALPAGALPVQSEYVPHLGEQVRPDDGVADLGAFEMHDGQPAALLVTTTSLPNAAVGLAYSAMLGASGGLPPYSWSVIAGALPGGVSLDAGTGAVAGIPGSAGTSSFTVQAADSRAPAGTASQPLQITVMAAPHDPLVVATSTLPSARKSRSYSAALAATGGQPPYVWSISAGSLPVGLTLDASSGLISGKPRVTGTASFTVSVSDSQPVPAGASRALAITVAR